MYKHRHNEVNTCINIIYTLGEREKERKKEREGGGEMDRENGDRDTYIDR